MVLGDDERMLGRNGPNVHEAVHAVRLDELHGRDLSRDDLAKDAVGVRLDPGRGHFVEECACGEQGGREAKARGRCAWGVKRGQAVMR